MPRFFASVPFQRGGLGLLACLLMLGTGLAEAPQKILLEPAKFELNGKRARQQMLVTGLHTETDLRDATHLVEFTSSNPGVVRVENGVAFPVANGSAQIRVKLGNLEAVAETLVSHMEQPSPVSFKNETLAALTKAGCNMGACHGSPSGKAGFRLLAESLRSALGSVDPADGILWPAHQRDGPRRKPDSAKRIDASRPRRRTQTHERRPQL